MQLRNRVERYRPRERRYDTDEVKRTAQQAVRLAVKRGAITKPDRCEGCKRRRPRRALEGHHFAGYARPLMVVFLCRECHAFQHVLEARIRALQEVAVVS